MKKLVLLLVLTVVAFGAFAEKGKGAVSYEAGAGLSFAMLDDSTASDADQIGAFILSLRGGIYGEALINLTDMIGVGGQVGIYYITWTFDDVEYTFVDFPIRAVVEADLAGLKLAAFGGYYLSIGFPEYSGPEVGAKIDLGGLYFQASSVMNPGNPTTRVELGISVGM